MFVRIHPPDDYKHGNCESCSELVHYLEKENEREGVEIEDREMFFSHNQEQVSSFDVTNSIDHNKAKLSKNEAKFYMLSVNPSQREMQFIAKQISGRNVSSLEEMTKSEIEKFKLALKDYTRGVMDEYGKNFNKELEGKDILYYGKVEHERRYSRFDKEVKDGLKKVGELKPGFQSHVHVIVSRKDITNKIRLSPFANHKNSKNILNGKQVQIGFNRKEFAQNCEKRFDSKFGYDRPLKHSFEYRHTNKNLMAKIAQAYARQGMPLLATAERNMYMAKNMDDPLKSAASLLSKNPDFAKAMKVVQMAARPEKAVIEAAKVAMKLIDKAAGLSL